MVVVEKIYMYKLQLGENEINVLGKDNIIKKVCFFINYVNESNFLKIIYILKFIYLVSLFWILLFVFNFLVIFQFRGYWQDLLSLKILFVIF